MGEASRYDGLNGNFDNYELGEWVQIAGRGRASIRTVCVQTIDVVVRYAD